MLRSSYAEYRHWRRWARIALALSALLHLLFLGGLYLAYDPQVRPPIYRVRLEPLPTFSYSAPSLLAPSRLPLPGFSPEGVVGPGEIPAFGMEGGPEGPGPGMAGMERLPSGPPGGGVTGEKVPAFADPALPDLDYEGLLVEKLRQEIAEREQYARFHLFDADTTDEESRRRSRARQIVERAIAAMGGRTALEQIREMRARVWIEPNEHCSRAGVANVPPYPYPVALWKYTAQGIFTSQPVNTTLSFDPDVPNTIATVRNPCITQPRYYQLFDARWGGRTPPVSAVIGRLREQGEAARWHFVDHFLGKGVEIHYLASEEFEIPYSHHQRDLGAMGEARQVDVVQVVDERYGQLQEAFFDEETGLLLALREGLTPQEQRWYLMRYAKEPPVWTTVLGNYQPIQGVLTPHRLVRGSTQSPGAVAVHLRIAYNGGEPDQSEPDVRQ